MWTAVLNHDLGVFVWGTRKLKLARPGELAGIGGVWRVKGVFWHVF
jgi:hypothetical protein